MSGSSACEHRGKGSGETYGGIDAALNNAGVMDGVFSSADIDYARQKPLIFAPLHEATNGYWDKVIRTNATGVFNSLRAELKQMVAQGRGGAIVNVGSIAGMTGLAGNPAYVASKHAVNGLTKNAAVDYAPYKIRVNSVNMAATNTPMVARAGQLVAAAMRANPTPAGMANMGRAKTQSLQARRPRAQAGHCRRTGGHDDVPAVGRSQQLHRRHLRHRRRLDRLLTTGRGEPARHTGPLWATNLMAAVGKPRRQKPRGFSLLLPLSCDGRNAVNRRSTGSGCSSGLNWKPTPALGAVASFKPRDRSIKAWWAYMRQADGTAP